MGRPRNLMVWFPMNGSVWPSSVSWGSKVRPVELCRAREKHFGTLAFIPDHASHLSTMVNKCWQVAGPSATMQVSSAYCKRLILSWVSERL